MKLINSSRKVTFFYFLMNSVVMAIYFSQNMYQCLNPLGIYAVLTE
jgi:hypothetical protein